VRAPAKTAGVWWPSEEWRLAVLKPSLHSAMAPRAWSMPKKRLSFRSWSPRIREPLRRMRAKPAGSPRPFPEGAAVGGQFPSVSSNMAYRIPDFPSPGTAP